MTGVVTRAVTANVESTLDEHAAIRCLDAALDLDPHIVGLQEWRLRRHRLLRPSSHRYHWAMSPLGDCVVGLRSDRFALRRSGSALLSWPAVADRRVRRVGLLPPRWATIVEAHDRQLDRRLGAVSFHLLPGAQSAGQYRLDRPRTAAQHRREVAALAGIISGRGRRCDAVWALGDSNFHGLGLPGLTSAWEGVAGTTGTLGSYRRIDDVFGPGPASRVETYVTESDHRMVLAERD